MIDKIIDLCNKIPKFVPSYFNWYDVEQFILYDDISGFVHIDGINRNQTILFKVRAKKSDLGLSFKYPCVYNRDDITQGKWRLKRLDKDILYKQNVTLFKLDDVFNLTYDSFEYSQLDYFIQNENCDQIEIRNGKFHGVYSMDLLNCSIIDGVASVGLKLISYDCPLRLYYKYDIFDVYCVVAPRITTEDIFYLRV